MTNHPVHLPTLDEVLACPSLPTLPAIAMRVLELARDDNVELDEIARVVQNDPALSAKILRTVNSSYYGLAQKCPTIARALPYLGMSTVKSLVLGFTLVSVSRATREKFDLTSYWRHCLFAAAAARRLAMLRNRSDPEEIFSAALMQDLGMLAIHAVVGPRYGDIIAGTHGDHRRLCGAESAALGYDHALVGARLGERWHLPTTMVAAIRHHHSADAADQTEFVRTVALGTELATAMSLPNPGAAVAGARARGAEWFGLAADQMNDLFRTINEDAEDLSELFEIKTGAPLDVNWMLAEAEEASVVHQLSMQRETETLRKSNDELAKMAVVDGLTNVGNRKRFDDELTSRFDQAAAFKGTLGLIIADADRFKVLNDTHGHQAGDAVLIELAERLKRSVRGIDLVCRYGGEEFGVVLPGASIMDVAVIAERLRVAVSAQPFGLGAVPGDGPDEIPVTISLGAAVYDPESAVVLSAPSLLLKAADKALYAAKQAGRNCARVFRVDAGAAAA